MRPKASWDRDVTQTPPKPNKPSLRKLVLRYAAADMMQVPVQQQQRWAPPPPPPPRGGTAQHSTLIAHVCMYVCMYPFGRSVVGGATAGVVAHTHTHAHPSRTTAATNLTGPASPALTEALRLRRSSGCCDGQHRGPTQAECLDLAASGLSCDLPCAGAVVIPPSHDLLFRSSLDEGLGRVCGG